MDTESIRGQLLIHNARRDDASTYIGDLLVRQRQVNSDVLEFSKGFLFPGARVIDACAGPEGSLLSASLHGYRWVGNEVSVKFASNLARTGAPNIVMSDFSRAPYQDSTTDGIILVFALNNICHTADTFKEASRVTKDRGVVVVADPGPALIIAKIIAVSLLANPPLSLELRGRTFDKDMPRFFESKDYTPDEYTDYMMEKMLGVSRDELRRELLDIFIGSGKQGSKLYRFHNQVLKHYFSFTVAQAQQARFHLRRAGLAVMGQIEDSSWQVSRPVEIPTENWIEEFMLARGQKSRVLSEVQKDLTKPSTRVFYPVLCFTK